MVSIGGYRAWKRGAEEAAHRCADARPDSGHPQGAQRRLRFAPDGVGVAGSWIPSQASRVWSG
jgi:hypothetical protein